MKTRIVNISDMHTGHRVALWPQEHITEQGQSIKASRAQLQLLEYWEDFWTHEAKDAEYVLLEGDMCEGKNPRGNAKDLMTPDLHEQIAANLALTEPKVKDRKIRGVVGSCYHSSDDMELDKLITEKLGGKSKGVIANLKLKQSKKIINFSHVVSEAVLYRPMAVDRDSLRIDAAKGQGKLDFHIDIYVRAHWHWFYTGQTENRTVILNPAWKLWAPIRKKIAKNWATYLPSIGGTVIEIDGDNVIVYKRTYPLISVYDKLEIER